MRAMGVSSPSVDGSTTNPEGVLESSHQRRGTFAHVVLRQQAARTRVLCSGRLGPHSSALVIQRPSPQSVVGSRRRPQAASRLGGSFRGRTLRRTCSVDRTASEGLMRLAALVILLREGKVWFRNGNHKNEGSFKALLRRLSFEFRENRMLSGVSVRRNVVAEVVGRQSDPEKRSSAGRVKSAERDDGRGRGSSKR